MNTYRYTIMPTSNTNRIKMFFEGRVVRGVQGAVLFFFNLVTPVTLGHSIRKLHIHIYIYNCIYLYIHTGFICKTWRTDSHQGHQYIKAPYKVLDRNFVHRSLARNKSPYPEENIVLTLSQTNVSNWHGSEVTVCLI